MSKLNNQQHQSLRNTAYKRLAEDAEAERERGEQDLYQRLADLEFQKVLDSINRIINSGQLTPQNRLEAVRDLIRDLYPYPDDPGYENDDEDEEDGQDVVRYGGKSPVDTAPNTK